MSLVAPSITSNVYAIYIMSIFLFFFIYYLLSLLLLLICSTVYLSAAFIEWFYVKYIAVMSVLTGDKFRNFIVETIKNYLILSYHNFHLHGQHCNIKRNQEIKNIIDCCSNESFQDMSNLLKNVNANLDKNHHVQCVANTHVWTQHVTKEEVLHRPGQQRQLLATNRRRQLQFLGHVFRISQIEK